jgi:hypothetical protein
MLRKHNRETNQNQINQIKQKTMKQKKQLFNIKDQDPDLMKKKTTETKIQIE